MSAQFSKFEAFGSISDPVIRKKLAKEIYLKLSNERANKISLSNSETDNFSSAIEEILSHEEMKELCQSDRELAEKVANDILDFVNQAKKKLNKTESPFHKENGMLDDFEETDKEQFPIVWKEVRPVVESAYDQKELNVGFYEQEFEKSLSKNPKIETGKPSFDSVKEHFIEKWDELLFKKQTKWELEFIEEQRKLFCEDLYRKIEDLKKLQSALEPFTNELGRLWDMSKGGWQKVNFDILKRYAEILNKDSALKELVESLGRMRQAEKIFEEETFRDIQLKPEWKVEHASKADLIGIRESDDLSSLLPSETAYLADETMEAVFFKKFAEKKLQTFEYQAKTLSYKEEEFQNKRLKEKEEIKGPFIICVDTSGSMHGTPEAVAKTLCFAVLKMAIRENRKCFLISFSTGIETLNLSDLKNSLDRIVDFLSMSFNGGTDATPAIRESLRMLETADYKKADVIMVSDFVMPGFDENAQTGIKKAKENGTKFHSLVIGKSQNASTIKEFDNNWFYDIGNPKSMLTLVKNINEIN